MEVLSGHRGSEVLHSGARQKSNPFSLLSSPYPLPSPRMLA